MEYSYLNIRVILQRSLINEIVDIQEPDILTLHQSSQPSIFYEDDLTIS